MASVDGSRSMQAGSDEVLTHICDPCNYDGIERKAVRFCQDCQEKLCVSCTEIHKRFKSSRNHIVVTIEDIGSVERATSPVSKNIFCSCDQNLPVTYFCESHDDVICKTCRTVKHRKCESVELLKKTTGYTTAKIDNILKRALKLKNEFETFTHDRNKTLVAVEESKNICLKEIQDYREEIKIYFDRLEENLCKELGQNESQTKQEIQRHVSICSATQTLIDSDIKTLDDAKANGQIDQMFASDVKVSSHLKELETVLADLQTENKQPIQIKFERNKRLIDALRNIESIGSLRVGSAGKDDVQSVVFGNKKVTAVTEANIICQDDNKTPWITGCAVLSGNKDTILCDNLNNKIKLLDNSFKVIDSLDIMYPWDAETLDTNEVIVTQPVNMKLQVIQVRPRMQTGRSISFDRKCWGISVIGHDIFISFHDAPGNGEIRVIDRNGIVKSVIGRTLSLDCPSYIFASPLVGKLYVSDSKKSAVYCMTPYGTTTYQYTSSDLYGVRGIYVDAIGDAVLCGRDTNNMYMLSSDGKTHKTLLSKSIPEPVCVSCRQDGETKLIVGCYKIDKLYILTLA